MAEDKSHTETSLSQTLAPDTSNLNNRKRTRGGNSPVTAQSATSSHVVTTSQVSEPPNKRPAPDIGKESDNDAIYEALGALRYPDREAMAAPPQSPTHAFAAQFDWQSMNTQPTGDRSSTDRVPLDPTLSSMRSGQDIPEIHFSDETLNSAAVSPGLGHNDDGGEGGDHLDVPEDGDKKEQPFSRSPELRVSHKLAERKRRKEMKELFDELRELLPAERGTKSSKWEILSKAIDHINSMKQSALALTRDVDRLTRELEMVRGQAYGSQPFHPYPVQGSYPPQGPWPQAGAAQPTATQSATQAVPPTTESPTNTQAKQPQ
ncbi:hypothetical protein BCR39DRAFT_562438 [Naematelia encephala]|uniref:BHLH domain-containing protein n=1 Tax=Naematelia encephala TaxID=71784 RepID=A0A1Y2AIX0_9TREE|nr:hypothetical protein BCR39DRAFT_562438 [Naematelia encephala]